MEVVFSKAGKAVGAVLLALLAGISLPLLIWAAIIHCFRQIYLEWRTVRAGLWAGNLACNLSTDCPPGYQCVDGRCQPVATR